MRSLFNFLFGRESPRAIAAPLADCIPPEHRPNAPRGEDYWMSVKEPTVEQPAARQARIVSDLSDPNVLFG